MKILAVESSAKTASAAVCECNSEYKQIKVVSEFVINASLTHSQTLVPIIQDVLKLSETPLKEIDFFAVSAGPGSFTGLRIGIAAVKGLSFGTEKPCIPVSTLHALAENMNIISDGIICPVMDARRNQVYNSLFASCENNNIKRLCDDRALSIEELLQELEETGKKIYLVGDGAELCYNIFCKSQKLNFALAPPGLRFQKASSAGIAALKGLSPGQIPVLGAHELSPVYLRIPQAERVLQNKVGVIKSNEKR